MSKRLIYILIGLMIITAGLELALPTLVSELIAQGMMNLTDSDHVSATVSKRPAILMLGGKFDTIHIAAQNVKTGRLALSEMQVALQNADIDLGRLMSQRQLEFRSVGDIDVTAVITEDDLARYLNHSIKGIKNAKVSITPETVKASSIFSLGGFANVTVGLEGKILSDSQKIKFVTERFFVNNIMTGNIAGATLTEIPLVDLNKLPFKLKVHDIKLEQGRIVVHLNNRS